MGKDERQTDYRITQILSVVRGRNGFELCRFDSKVHTMKTLLLNRVGVICEISAIQGLKNGIVSFVIHIRTHAYMCTHARAHASIRCILIKTNSTAFLKYLREMSPVTAQETS